MVVRLAVHVHWLAAAELATPSLALQIIVITFLGSALYVILKWHYHKPVIVPLGWGLPSTLTVRLDFLAALWRRWVLPSPCTSATKSCRHSLPWIFLVLGFFLGPILENSVFRGCLLPVLARTIGNTASVVAMALLFSAFHGPRDVTHWVWFCATGIAYGWLRLVSHTTSAAALMRATCKLSLFLAAKL